MQEFNVEKDIFDSDKSIFILHGPDGTGKNEKQSILQRISDNYDLCELDKKLLEKQESDEENSVYEYIRTTTVEMLLADYFLVCCRTLEDLNNLDIPKIYDLTSGFTFKLAFSLLENKESKYDRRRKLIIITHADPQKSDLFSENNKVFEFRTNLIEANN